MYRVMGPIRITSWVWRSMLIGYYLAKDTILDLINEGLRHSKPMIRTIYFISFLYNRTRKIN